MRMPLISSVVALSLAVPLAIGATGPQMTEAQFISAVRCTAYSGLEDVSGADAAVRAERMRLNIEAADQSPEVAARARAEIRAIHERAESADAATLAAERNAACGQAGALLANRALAPEVG